MVQTALDPDFHVTFMRMALVEAEKSAPVPTAFCVGCVLVTRLPRKDPTILATGYSRELPGNTHAEANALTKASEMSAEELNSLFSMQDATLNDVFAHTDAYTTMEPCSIRTSGLSPCADGLIAAKVRRCVIGVSEPPDFVNCEGAARLKAAGIEVIWLEGLEEACLRVARGQHY